MIRSGLLTGHLDKLEKSAALILKANDTSKNISVRVIDPVIENLSKELGQLNFSVSQLQESNKPQPLTTFFQEANYFEIIMLVMGALILGIFATVAVQWSFKKFSQKGKLQQSDTNPNVFEYYEWLKRLESNLKAFKVNEEQLTEEHINLKILGMELCESRKRLNLADNQQDYYLSLEMLNSAAPKLEDYFEKVNIKKNAELSRRMIKLVIQLCDAIESRHEISLVEPKGKAKAAKFETQAVALNVA